MKKIGFLTIIIIAILTIIQFNKKSSDEVLRVGVEGAYIPWGGIDPSGNVIGFEVELANIICEKINRKCKFIKQDWDGIIPALLNNKYDVIMAGITITEERKKKINFTRGYADTGVAVGSLSLEKSNSVEELLKKLEGKKLGVQTGTISAKWADKTLKNTIIRSYGTQEELNIDLLNGRIDAGMNDTSVWTALQKGNEDIKIVSPILTSKDDPLFGEGIGIGVKKGRTELLSELNRVLDEMSADGSLSDLATKWFGYDASLR
jgi:octopine/nopaline transport system substrate-binding protein